MKQRPAAAAAEKNALHLCNVSRRSARQGKTIFKCSVMNYDFTCIKNTVFDTNAKYGIHAHRFVVIQSRKLSYKNTIISIARDMSATDFHLTFELN